ncbi:MAG: hypothetical protein ACI8RZ_008088, partial [Myxococcota bacterium]
KKTKLSIKSLLEGGPQAFARRADKVAAELDEVEDLLSGTAFTKLLRRHTALSRQLASARASAESTPKSAYQELKTVKDRARALTQMAQDAEKIGRRLAQVKARLTADLTEDKILNNSAPIIRPFMTFLSNVKHNQEPVEYVQALMAGSNVRQVFITYGFIDSAGALRSGDDFIVNVSSKSVKKYITEAAQSGWGNVSATAVLTETRAQVLSDLGPMQIESSMMGQFVRSEFPFNTFSAADLDIKNVDAYTAQLSTWKGLLGM